MQAFVTGGTGFIGANLVRLLLNEGYSVRALARASEGPKATGFPRGQWSGILRP